MATEKQVRYLLFLLKKNGYSTKWMNREFKELGASMRERTGTVEHWLRSLDVATASELIKRLQGEE
jgi:DNA-binding MarR family transcriptional regulator